MDYKIYNIEWINRLLLIRRRLARFGRRPPLTDSTTLLSVKPRRI